ncbi:hypothetical protein HDV01_004003 [Terramyces sp. JEL0728]|nr:hypothetical protein HDV01_004003 [Terramyces sp. JEL0728]
MLASLIGNLPGAILNSFIGSLFNSVTDAEKAETPLRAKLLSGLIGGCFFIGSTVFITIISRKALRNTVDIESEPGSESNSTHSTEVISTVDAERADNSLEVDREPSTNPAPRVQIVLAPVSSSGSSVQDIGDDSQQELVNIPVENNFRQETGFTRNEVNTMIFVSIFILVALAVGLPLIILNTTPKGTTWKS